MYRTSSAMFTEKIEIRGLMTPHIMSTKRRTAIMKLSFREGLKWVKF